MSAITDGRGDLYDGGFAGPNVELMEQNHPKQAKN
jgi:hypothetical protein